MSLQKGNAMMKDGHQASPEIKTILGDLNTQWKDLTERAEDRGNRLRQAAAQHALNKALADAQVRLLAKF